jgi:hypothetical protein
MNCLLYTTSFGGGLIPFSLIYNFNLDTVDNKIMAPLINLSNSNYEVFYKIATEKIGPYNYAITCSHTIGDLSSSVSQRIALGVWNLDDDTLNESFEISFTNEIL